MKNNLLFMFIMFLSLSAKAIVTCSDILGGINKQQVLISEASKVKDPKIIYKVKLNIDDRFSRTEVSKEDLVDLFQMFGRTQFFNASEKITLEKGTLYLGQKIDNFLSAQAEYTFDKPNKKLHLTRISIVNSKNGQEQVLTKEPLDYTGTKFSKDNYNLVFENEAAIGKVLSSADLQIPTEATDVTPSAFKSYSLDKYSIHYTEVPFPTVISHAAFEKVLKWSLVIPHLDHVEINVVDSVNKQKWTIAKGQFRRFAEFAKDRFFKQAFGLLVVYAIFDSMSGFSTDVAKYFVDVVQTQNSSISVKVKETLVDGKVINTEQKFKINMQKKKENTPDEDGEKK